MRESAGCLHKGLVVWIRPSARGGIGEKSTGKFAPYDRKVDANKLRRDYENENAKKVTPGNKKFVAAKLSRC